MDIWQFIVQGPPDKCWAWTGPVNRYRGDRPQIGGKNASRYLWIELHGEPPEGHHVEHICEHRWCMNPAHFDAVDPSANYARLRRSHCKNGHELTPENRVDAGATGHGDSRRSKCRICTADRERRRHLRRYRRRVKQGAQ